MSQDSAMHSQELHPHRSLPAVFPHKPLHPVVHQTEVFHLAIRSIPVVVIVSPLSVNNVAIECSTECVPLRSMGVTPLPHYYGDIRLPLNRWASSRCTGCATLLPGGRIQGISRVPDFALVTCHGLRPRWTLQSLGPWLLRCCLPCCTSRRHPHVGYFGALSLHAGALQPITSLCTLRWHRYRCQRNTQYLVPDHGFQD